MPTGRTFRATPIIGFLLASMLSSVASGAEVTKEYQLKAAFLYNFTRFIEWPDRRFAAVDSPIVIGVYGRNPFDDELERVVAGREAAGRPLLVRNVNSPQEALETHLLFVPLGEEPLLATLGPQFDRAGIITVGESEQFANFGGTIRFVVQGDKLRFAIRDISGGVTGVHISSQLLKLATAVHK